MTRSPSQYLRDTGNEGVNSLVLVARAHVLKRNWSIRCSSYSLFKQVVMSTEVCCDESSQSNKN